MESPFKETLKSFCLSTSQHGFKFIFLPKRTLLEKCFWVLIITTCLTSITVYGWLVYQTYVQQQFLTSTDTIHQSIWQYQFPAVTICNTNKLSLSKIDKSLKLFKNFSGTPYNQETFRKDLLNLYEIVYPSSHVPSTKLSMLETVLKNNGILVKDLFELISPDCDLLVRCKLKGYLKRCDQMFQKILTVHGYCCSYNYFAINATAFGREAPAHVAQCSYKTTLHIIMNTKRPDYGAYEMNTSGFYLFVHYPYDYVDWSNEFVLLGQSTGNFVSIKPVSTYTSDYLTSMKPKERNCLFQDERKLEMFNKYTYRNCLMQCRMTVLYNKCGCIPFYYNLRNSSYKVCELKDSPCVFNMKYEIINSNVNREAVCDCPEDCENIDYTVAYSGAILSEALLGGVMGLFNGISIISIIEVLYFFIIRLTIAIRAKDSKAVDKGKEIFVVDLKKPSKKSTNENRPSKEKIITLNWIP